MGVNRSDKQTKGHFFFIVAANNVKPGVILIFGLPTKFYLQWCNRDKRMNY